METVEIVLHLYFLLLLLLLLLFHLQELFLKSYLVVRSQLFFVQLFGHFGGTWVIISFVYPLLSSVLLTLFHLNFIC